MPKKLEATIQSIILDMDGVITDSARLHAEAWKQMFDEFLAGVHKNDYVPLDIEKDYNRYINGISRNDGVRAFLQSRHLDLPEGNADDGADVDSIFGLAKRKNILLLALIEKEGVDVFPDSLEMIKRWKNEGKKLAVISASRNCRLILESAGVLHYFDVRVDGETARKEQIRGKPEPDVFLKAMEGLNGELAHTMIIEDAIAGVKAGKKGLFSLVVGVARNGEAEDLKRAGADLVVRKLTEVEAKMNEIKQPEDFGSLSHGLESFTIIKESMKGKKPVLFFDYDGTLTPIVEDPNAAQLSSERRKFLEELSDVFTIAIVSGRGLDDLKSKVGLDQLIYAGSHGFEISGPNGLEMDYGPGQEIIPALDKVEKTLTERVKTIGECKLERKKYALAVHYRRVGKEQVATVKKIVNEVLKGQQQLRVGKGKKILEIKPNLDWDKGHALNWLMEELNLNLEHHFPIFIGDDITDEDALKVAGVMGFLVGSHGQKTYADYRLTDTEEVYQFLEELRKGQPLKDQ